MIIGAIVAFGNDQRPKRETLGTASMTIDKKEVDFGNMNVSDEKTATFTIANTSDQTLRIWNITTSCNCTFASIDIGGVKTGEFNMPMHTEGYLKNWIGEVSPQQTATLLVTYKPSVMPVSGPVNRQTRFATNDPNNPEIEVTVRANVL